MLHKLPKSHCLAIITLNAFIYIYITHKKCIAPSASQWFGYTLKLINDQYILYCTFAWPYNRRLNIRSNICNAYSWTDIWPSRSVKENGMIYIYIIIDLAFLNNLFYIISLTNAINQCVYCSTKIRAAKKSPYLIVH